jgi:hypothetical protein
MPAHGVIMNYSQERDHTGSQSVPTERDPERPPSDKVHVYEHRL